MKRILAVLLTICLVASCVPFAMAASAKTSGTANELRLEATEGKVQLKNAAGKKMKLTGGTRLYSGYTLATKKSGYAYVSLDETKAVKLGTSTKAEVFRSGKKLELKVSSGELFFNVTAPLKADESLTIRTSTMVTSVRGTCGWVEVMDRHTTRVSLLEGKLDITSIDPLTRAQRTTTIVGGQTATIVYHGADQTWVSGVIIEDLTIQDLIEADVIHGENIVLTDTGLTVEDLEEVDVPGSVSVEVKKDKDLQDRIDNTTDLSVPEIVKDAEKRQEEDEQEEDAADQEIQDAVDQMGAENTDPIFGEEPSQETDTGGSPAPEPEPVQYQLGISYKSSNGRMAMESIAMIAAGSEYTAAPLEFDGYVYVNAEGDALTGVMDGNKHITFYYDPIPLDLYDPTTAELQAALNGGYEPIYIYEANDENTLDFAAAVNGSNAGMIDRYVEIGSGTVTIGASDTVTVDQTAVLFITTTVTNNGSLIVNGTTEVSTGGTLINEGTITNSGSVDLTYGGEVLNNGTMTGTGNVMFSGTAFGFLNNTGTLIAEGTIGDMGTVTTSGTMSVHAAADNIQVTGGTFTVETGGKVKRITAGSTTEDTTVNIKGTVTAGIEVNGTYATDINVTGGTVQDGIVVANTGGGSSIRVDGGTVSSNTYAILSDVMKVSVSVTNGGIVSGGIAGILIQQASGTDMGTGTISVTNGGQVLAGSAAETNTVYGIDVSGYDTSGVSITVDQSSTVSAVCAADSEAYAVYNLYGNKVDGSGQPGPATVTVNNVPYNGLDVTADVPETNVSGTTTDIRLIYGAGV